MNTLPELIPAWLWAKSPGSFGAVSPGSYGGLTAGPFGVVRAPRSAMPMLLGMAARLALTSAVRVLDCGNCFNVYTVTQALHQHMMDTTAALKRISVARAFTCYQVTTLLECTPQDSTPTLVLDLLATFHDESVSLGERRRLLDRNVTALRRLSRQGSVLVSIHPGGAQAQACGGLVEAVEETADQVWHFEVPEPAPVLRLF
ncbi:MAG: hypothetical protein L0Z70_07745 [Chloroflexi bacterium]|nr:hypothetical protein [Chloroflexota bacterium]